MNDAFLTLNETNASFITCQSRRTLLRGGAVGIGAVAAGLVVPAVAQATQATPLVRRERPVLAHGVQTGDVTSDGALLWTRADRPSRMLVEVSRDRSFRHARRLRGPVLTPSSDGTGKLRLTHLPPGREVFYRVRAEDLDGRVSSEPLTGSFRTAPIDRADVRFVWSGDTAGQGWGINPDIGGMTAYAAMAARRPDFFIHSGDTVYADGPLAETVTLPDGRVWRNIVTPEKSKVAESLAEYRGQFAYNLLDHNVRAFAAAVPSVVQWDDHEVVNNWYPGEILTLPAYTEKRVDVLAARAFQAFHEWQPIDARQAVDGRIYRSFRYGRHVEIFILDMRSYKDPNPSPRDGAGRVLSERQARWLVNGLSSSRATWKIVAADLPIGLIVPDGTDIEGVANGLPGVPGGREHELAGVLRELSRRTVRNVVWLTADVHYTAAHHYSPDRAAVGDFDPFLEIRLRPPARRRVRAEHAGPDVRPGCGVHARPAGRQHLAAGRVPALRRGRGGWTQWGADRAPARRPRRRAVVDDPAARTPLTGPLGCGRQSRPATKEHRRP